MISALKGHLLLPFQGWLIILGLIQGRRAKARSPLATFCRAFSAR